MNVSDHNALPVFRGVGICVQKGNPAIGGFLVSMIGDRTNFRAKRGVGSRLSLVIPALHKVKEMIVGPVTRFHYGTPLRVPCDAIWIARPLADDLEFAAARVHPPHSARETVFPAVVGANP